MGIVFQKYFSNFLEIIPSQPGRDHLRATNINLTSQYLNIIIALDQQISNYNRAVYSFFDMLGLLGGIFGLLHSIGFVLVRFVSTKQFYSFVVANLTNTKSAFNQSQTNEI